MLSKKLWLPALFAASLAFPTVVHAQEMGGGMGGDEKKDEPKADEPKKEEPKPEEPKKEEPKPEAKKQTLAFEAPASFGDDKGRGMTVHRFQLKAEEGEQDALVVVIHVGQSADYEKEKSRWVSQFEDKDGKKLDKSAIKEESFDANGTKGKIAEVTGNFAPRARRGKKAAEGEGDAKPEKKWTKVINIFLEGPDGGWVLRLQGGEKTVDKYKADFIAYAKSAKVVEGTTPGGERPRKNKKGNE